MGLSQRAVLRKQNVAGGTKLNRSGRISVKDRERNTLMWEEGGKGCFRHSRRGSRHGHDVGSMAGPLGKQWRMRMMQIAHLSERGGRAAGGQCAGG